MWGYVYNPENICNIDRLNNIKVKRKNVDKIVGNNCLRFVPLPALLKTPQ